MLVPMLLVTVPVVAMWIANEDDEAHRDDVRWAQQEARMSDKEFAACLDITPPQLSDQMAMRGHLSFWRMRKLPPAFHIALYERRLRRMGKRIVDDTTVIVEHAAMLKLIDAVQTLTGSTANPQTLGDVEREDRIA